ncbi:MAG TPA: 1,4-dihydroxy-2-naphthoate polyprenyltransferase [Cyclobacteriaceae bacterium]|nr:1,4-dihydroxy-2-naphthoate polyprenyltransferase [Cyclobacteriaceae bacterium]
MNTRAWISAFRLRTLPLSLSCIGMAAFLAAAADKFNGLLFFLCCLTTVFLQILSNLANDYGDSVNGADHAGRTGPQRAVQSGAISASQMRNAVVLFAVLCLLSGIGLLLIAFGLDWNALLFFLVLGALCIAAAIAYTVGRKPYGYAGLGDLSVLIFFGLVGVMGSLYLFTRRFDYTDILPAFSCGFFSIAVLNVNNVRDIESDRQAGKFSIPVRIGRERAIVYHWFLLSAGTLSAVVYTILRYESAWQFLFLPAVALFVRNGIAVTKLPSEKLDPWLKQMAMSTLLFVVTFGIGLLL